MQAWLRSALGWLKDAAEALLSFVDYWLWKGVTALNEWANGAMWRTWLLHALIAAPICWLFGPKVAVVFYLLRELEQLAHAWMAGRFATWYDYPLDVFAPGAVCALWALLQFPVVL